MSTDRAIVPLDGERLDTDRIVEVDYDDRDFGTAPEGAAYALVDAPIDAKTFFRSAQSAIRDHVHRHDKVAILANPELKVYSRPGESEGEFLHVGHLWSGCP